MVDSHHEKPRVHHSDINPYYLILKSLAKIELMIPIHVVALKDVNAKKKRSCVKLTFILFIFQIVSKMC